MTENIHKVGRTGMFAQDVINLYFSKLRAWIKRK